MVGKDEFSLRNIETLLAPPAARAEADEAEIHAAAGRAASDAAACWWSASSRCSPAWRAAAGRRRPTPIAGFVTRGKGVAIHRAQLQQPAAHARAQPGARDRGRTGAQPERAAALYPVDVQVEASDRQGLLRDISEVFAKEKINVTGVKTSR